MPPESCSAPPDPSIERGSPRTADGYHRVTRRELVMGKTRRMRLVAFLKTGPTAHHHGMWRHPETDNDFLDPAWYEHVARVLEKGKFDCLFFADTLGLFDNFRGNFHAILKGGGQMGFLDPLPVLAVMARVTQHIGLG